LAGSRVHSKGDFNILAGKNGFVVQATPGVRYAVYDCFGKNLQQGRTSLASQRVEFAVRKKGVYLVKINGPKQSLVKRVVLQ
jgi:hypothetical protein